MQIDKQEELEVIINQELQKTALQLFRERDFTISTTILDAIRLTKRAQKNDNQYILKLKII